MNRNYDRHPTLKVGDQVRCLRPISFCDGTSHGLNDILEVEEETLPYFQLFTDNRNYEVFVAA